MNAERGQYGESMAVDSTLHDVTEPAGFVETLTWHAECTPARPAVVYCTATEGGLAERAVSFTALDGAARRIAGWLGEHRRRGDRVLLPFPAGLDFVRAFVGCLYAGLVPVPAPLPGGHRYQIARTTGIAMDSGASLVITDRASLPVVTRWAREEVDAGLLVVDHDEIVTTGGSAPVAPAPERDALAFLQYTSGSTSEPKGVMVSHGNLVHNIDLMRRTLGWTEDMRFCSWLPAYHDMGLIAMLLAPLYLGGGTVLLSPTDFLKRPYRWLELIDRYDARVSTAPNFGYELCARRISDEQAARLDLSRWSYACNGAEPINPDTLARFAAKFAPAGFRPEALIPGYGLAETTLFVSASKPDRAPTITRVDADSLARHDFRPDPDGVRMVSSGVVNEPGGLDVRIADPATGAPLADGRIGEILVGGGSVTQGYWHREAETRRAFGADGFLHTGDLGAIRAGELYITGRIKEMLVIRGRNLYPHDIEREVGAVDPMLADLPCCVFSVPAPEEEVVVLQELRVRGVPEQTLRELAGRIKNALGTALGVRVAGVSFLRLGAVRRTTSGKIQRTLMRDLFSSGALDPVHEDLDPVLRRRYRPVPETADLVSR